MDHEFKRLVRWLPIGLFLALILFYLIFANGAKIIRLKAMANDLIDYNGIICHSVYIFPKGEINEFQPLEI